MNILNLYQHGLAQNTEELDEESIKDIIKTKSLLRTLDQDAKDKPKH